MKREAEEKGFPKLSKRKEGYGQIYRSSSGGTVRHDFPPLHRPDQQRRRPSHYQPLGFTSWMNATSCLHINAPSHRCFRPRFVPRSGVVPARRDLYTSGVEITGLSV
jgi:hypothetical protein